MMCLWAKERIAASWTGELEGHEQTKLRAHLAECPDCAAEMMQLSAMWERLADIPAPEPSLALQARWDSTLESLGVQRQRPRRPEAWKFSLRALWPNRPVWQVTIAAACLVAGLTVGSYRGSGSRQSNSNEIASLREEVASTKEMVALSLLKEQSASERLRGVDYSVQMPKIEPEVIAALIQAVNQDPSVNVRLAAIDALTRASAQPKVRQSLEQSLNKQDSPTVQAALISYLVDARDRGALSTLRQFANRPDVDQTVRERAGRATKQLTEFR
jgi:hypothetical protein